MTAAKPPLSSPLRPPPRGSSTPQATILLIVYALATSGLLLWVVSSGVLDTLGNFRSLTISLSFAAFLTTLFLAYRWKAHPIVKILVAAVCLLVVLPIAGVANSSLLGLGLQIGIFAALALGLNIVVGLAGLLDLGYVAFFATGAYIWAIYGSPQIGKILGNPALEASKGLPGGYFWLFLFLGIAVAALVGVLIGLPVLRLRGDYLAIVTLGLGEVIRVLANNLTPLTNGPIGIVDIQRPPTGLIDGIRSGFNLSNSQFGLLFLYVVVLVVIGIIIVVNIRLENSRIGRAWIAIREDEIAAQAMGVPLVRSKIIAFATGASFAGVMGVIYSAVQTSITPESFTFFASIGVLSMVILGGMGSIPGVILGAAVVTLLNLDTLAALSEALSGLGLPNELDPAKYQRFFFGLILLLMMIFRPEGLLPTTRRKLELHLDDVPSDSDGSASGDHGSGDIGAIGKSEPSSLETTGRISKPVPSSTQTRSGGN